MNGLQEEGQEVPVNAMRRLEVVLHSMGMPFNGNTIAHESLGGSESAAYYQARELARRGHHVTLFTSHRDGGQVDGVTYVWHGDVTPEAPLGAQFDYYVANTPHDVLIIQRHPLAFHKQWQAKVCVHQLHDLALHRSYAQFMAGQWQTTLTTCVSEWHRQQVLGVYGLNPDSVKVVPNGVDPELYTPLSQRKLLAVHRMDVPTAHASRNENGVAYSLALPKDKFVMLYQSRPERGLEHLVRPGGIMDRLQRDGWDQVHLVVVGYENTVPQMRAYYEQLRTWGTALPNISFLGALSKYTLAELQQKCDLLIYPTEFGEVSCITAMEAMHAGLPLLTSAHAALPETCKDSGTILLPLQDGKADEDMFVAEIIKLIHADKQEVNELGRLREAQREAARTRTWAHAVDALERELYAALEPTETGRLVTARQLSDVRMARSLAATTPGAISFDLSNEIDDLYGAIIDPAKTFDHYKEHQGKYYDEFEDRVIGEDVTNTTRFRGTYNFIEDFVRVNSDRQLRVMDYGCAHGHYLVPLATVFPAHQFLGLDISTRAVDAVNRWLQREGIVNADAVWSDQAMLVNHRYDKDEPDSGFDLILAGEVVEHVWDAVDLLNDLRACLRPGGRLVVTTPCGPWESSGTVAFRTGREHVHHFEKGDIREICKDFPHQLVYAPAGAHRNGMGLGSWVWGVDCGGANGKFHAIDYTEKARVYGGRQSIGAALIVKDAEKTLRRCLESFVDWVDQVVIAVDPSTTDRTGDVLSDFIIDFPHVELYRFHLAQPVIASGFDVARNEAIAKLETDWVLWLDADEEIHQPWNLQRVARASGVTGYCYAQVHYAADPAQVLTTDYPCRMFRRSPGTQFYGRVHEHPEVEPGKAIPHAVMRPDVKFLHAGYVDEETRRKRYHRNLPLLRRDMTENPTRGLNKFLWLRDIAQGIGFERQNLGGALLPEHIERAREGVALFEEMLVSTLPLKMVVDALPYYTMLVELLGGGFEAEVRLSSRHPVAPDLATTIEVRALFRTREHYCTLITRIIEETTKNYEHEYL